MNELIVKSEHPSTYVRSGRRYFLLIDKVSTLVSWEKESAEHHLMDHVPSLFYSKYSMEQKYYD